MFIIGFLPRRVVEGLAYCAVMFQPDKGFLLTAGSKEQPGKIIEFEKPIHASNVRICVDEERPVKLKVKTDEEGNRQLYYANGDTHIIYRSIKNSKL